MTRGTKWPSSSPHRRQQRLRPWLFRHHHGPPRLGWRRRRLPPLLCYLSLRQHPHCPPPRSWRQAPHPVPGPGSPHLRPHHVLLDMGVAVREPVHDQHRLHHPRRPGPQSHLSPFRDDNHLKLPHCIAVAGLVCAVFAFSIPHLSVLRIWLDFSTFFGFIYIFVTFGLALRDGMNSPARYYGVPGTEPTKVFSTIGAMASLVFVYNTGMIPEIQATVRPSVIKNMEKALYFQFTAGNVLLYLVAFVGY